jgi:hypothetical protein
MMAALFIAGAFYLFGRIFPARNRARTAKASYPEKCSRGTRCEYDGGLRHGVSVVPRKKKMK